MEDSEHELISIELVEALARAAFRKGYQEGVLKHANHKLNSQEVDQAAEAFINRLRELEDTQRGPLLSIVR